MDWKKVLVTIVVLLSTVHICHGQEATEAAEAADSSTMPKVKHQWYGFDFLKIGRKGEQDKLEVELSTTVLSKHMWHGLDLLDDHGAFIPSATVRFGDTGLAGKILYVEPLGDEHVKSVELNYVALYSGTLFKDSVYKTDFTANYFYYGKPKQGARKADTQEAGIGVSWPELIRIGEHRLIPSYYFGSIWQSHGDSDNSGIEGFIHVFGLGYDVTAPNFWGPGQKQVFRLMGDITYNDGFGGKGIDHDWSHATFGISTELKITRNLSFAPGLYYQVSMDDSVNDEDEIWCGGNLIYRF